MRVMAAKDGVQGRRRLRIFAAAVALVLLCAVCVGGVSGATWSVPADGSLANVVTNAKDGDIIVITSDNYVIDKQVVLSHIETMDGVEKGKNITITNAAGVNVQISSGFTPLKGGDSYDTVDSKTLFKVNAGKLLIKSNDSGGSLTITTNRNGRAFDVNYDDRRNQRAGNHLGATLQIEGSVSITNCGFANINIAKSNNGGAVYIRPAGTFIMNSSCSLSANQAGAGGAVYVDQGYSVNLGSWWNPNYVTLDPGVFIMNGGSITGNYAINTGNHDSWGGGVWCHNDATFNWNYPAEIYGNGAAGVPNNANQANYEQVYPEYNPPAAPEVPEEPDAPEEPRYYPIYAFSENKAQYGEYDTVREAYNDFVTNKSVKEFTICLRENYEQKYTTVEQNGVLDPVLDAVTIQNGINVTLMPDSQSVTLTLRNQMFVVSSGGSLTIANNNSAKLTVTAPTAPGLVDGGFVSVNGGSLTLKDVEISEVRGNKGGAIYLTNSGICTLISGSITGCMASESGKGAAVYVEDGTLVVDNGATISDSNDVYLAENQVITITDNYSGSIGKITLSDYPEGRYVVNITQNPTISSSKFSLNPADADKYKDMALLKTNVDNSAITYLVLGVGCQFTIIIPADLSLSTSTYDGVMTVIAEDVTIPRTDWISVSVSSQNNFNLISKPDEALWLPYNITLEDSTLITNVNAEIANFTTSDTVDMTVQVTTKPQYAGLYEDVLTFTVQYGTA